MAFEDGAQEYVQPTLKGKELAWSPEYVRNEVPQPPAIDVRIEEEAAAQAAAQAAGYEGRRARKFLQRRTVDYTGTYLHDRLVSHWSSSAAVASVQ